jgi:hypothetical protein
LEQARVYRLRDVQCQARVLYVRLDGLTAIREQLEARVQVSDDILVNGRGVRTGD